MFTIIRHFLNTLFIYLKNNTLFSFFTSFTLKKTSPEILSHFDKNSSTYVIWRDKRGAVFSESVETLSKKNYVLEQFSIKDAFLLGYLLGAAHEKFI